MAIRDWKGTAKMTVQKLGGIIGTTGDTGGTATAGTLMAKVNALLTGQGTQAKEETSQEILGRVGLGAVKSIQRGLIPSGSKSTGYTEAFRFGTATNYTRVGYYDIKINEVEPDKCSVNICVYGYMYGSTYPHEIVNPTTLRVYHDALTSSETSEGVQPFSWEVVEFY